MHHTENSRSWRHHGRTPTVQLYLTDRDGRAGALVGEHAAGFALAISPFSAEMPIDPASLTGAAAAVIEVSADDPSSVARFGALAGQSRVPLVAAVYDPPLALVRQLVRAGAHDVVPLPLELGELEATLAPIRDRRSSQDAAGSTLTGKLVSVIKSGGGVGATALLTQLAVRFAEREARAGRDTCLFDLDLQFGDAAFQLGLRPTLSLSDLLDAGARLDGALLRAAGTAHPSGLKLISAPPEMMPLESLSNEQLMQVVDIALGEFGTVFLDLPANWTNWSLSLVARSNLVLLVTEMTIPALRQARRQIELLREQDLGEVDIRVVVNNHEKSFFGTVRSGDAEVALGREVAFMVSREDSVMRAATDQGVPVAAIKRKSAVARDLDTLDAGLVDLLGLVR